MGRFSGKPFRKTVFWEHKKMLAARFINEVAPALCHAHPTVAFVVVAENTAKPTLNLYKGANREQPDMTVDLDVDTREITLCGKDGVPKTMGHLRRTITTNRALRHCVAEIAHRLR